MKTSLLWEVFKYTKTNFKWREILLSIIHVQLWQAENEDIYDNQ